MGVGHHGDMAKHKGKPGRLIYLVNRPLLRIGAPRFDGNSHALIVPGVHLVLLVFLFEVTICTKQFAFRQLTFDFMPSKRDKGSGVDRKSFIPRIPVVKLKHGPVFAIIRQKAIRAFSPA
jgi:hypothetical protein